MAAQIPQSGAVLFCAVRDLSVSYVVSRITLRA